MVFGLGRKAKKDEASEPDDSLTTAESREDAAAGSGVRANGPLDESEITSRDGYVDLGALLIAPSDGLQLRLEVEEATQRVVAVTLDLNGSSLQLQAFAAPKTEGLWDEIREQIGQSVGAQGGQDVGLQGVGVLVLVDQDVVEHAGHQPRNGIQRPPAEQQIVIIEELALPLPLD
ncbi:MAG: hypothetical protein C0488_14670, partial [Arthrobacter sp.]|nr:hypothetical protein [Arthrobacter sp.]